MPQASSAPARNFQWLNNDMTAAGDVLTSLEMVNGALYAQVTTADGEYQVLTYTDVLTVKPALAAPKDGTNTGASGSVTLSWNAVSAPGKAKYAYDIATDAKFANKVNTYPETTGTSVTVSDLTAGTKYWWRVYVTEVSGYGVVASPKSDSWTFSPALAPPELKSPAYGQDDAIQHPTFSWIAVPGATSYELDVADNAFYANSEMKKPLTHTAWTWDVELDNGTTYYWRVRAVAKDNTSTWSEAVFTVNPKAGAVGSTPPVIVQQPAPLPDIVLNPPAPVLVPAQPIIIPAAPPSPITPAVIWAIIIIGAVLFIAVIVLIVRTRRIS
jgi:hypothetical protein